MSEYISAVLRRKVRQRAYRRCEYCFMPDSEPLYPHEPDHIIALKHAGRTISDNMAYACFECNHAKGSDIAPLDPDTKVLTPLYNPRTENWATHFRFNGPVIVPLTAIGRVTVRVLQLNSQPRVAIRESLMREGRYTVPESRNPSLGQRPSNEPN